ncbi:MAG: siroheme synthase [Parvibaculaceae bacterium]
MRYFPIFTDFGGARVLVVGGGDEAANKVRLLLKTEARIEIVAERLNGELDGLVSHGGIAWVSSSFEDGLLDGVAAVFVAANEETNHRASRAARARNLPVNVVDHPSLSNFIVPAIVDRDPVVVAIGTEGAGPVLAQGVRAQIEQLLPSRLGALALAARRLRERVALSLPHGAARRQFWQSFFFGPIREAFLAGDRTRFETSVTRELIGQSAGETGRVALVGAGPGDPEMLTLKAHRRLQEADVIVHDANVPSAILDFARRDAGRVLAGADNDATVETLIEEAAKGKVVVRLVAGRGSFEAEGWQLRAAGIAFDVVMGVGPREADSRVIEFPQRDSQRAAS